MSSPTSAQFKKWFGSSQVTDESGTPMPVYHGTNAVFDTFDNSRIGSKTDDGWLGKGHYFTSDKSAAEAYGKKIIPAYLAARNIFNMKGKNFNKVLQEHGGPQGFTDWLRQNGYDGAKMWSQYMVLDPHQIKHATDNEGSYDASNPNMYKASGGAIEDALRIARAHGGHVKLHVGPIHSRVSGRTDHLPVHVPSGAYVLPADIVSAMGEGNTAAGFEHVKRVFGGLPYHGKGNVPYAGGDGPYGSELPRAAGGSADNTGAPVPCVLAGGEYVLSPDEVLSAGDGDMDAGHRALDEFVKQYRAKTIKTLKGLPGPRRD